MKQTKNNSGLTLVEIIVTLIVASVLAGIIMTFYMVQTREVSESSQYAFMNRSYDLFLEQFGRDVRFSNRAMDTVTLADSVTDVVKIFSDTTVTALRIYNENQQIAHTYIISGDTLYYDGAPFTVGNGEVMMVEMDSSGFNLSALRQNVESYIQLIRINGTDTLVFPTRRDVFKCRN